MIIVIHIDDLLDIIGIKEVIASHLEDPDGWQDLCGGERVSINQDFMFSSKSDLWETPQSFFDALDREFHFDLDVCALSENAKCSRYYTQKEDGLSQPCRGVCWFNPPYGRRIGQWVKRGRVSLFSGATVVMLLPARTDTTWFHEYILHRGEIRFLRGRLQFGRGGQIALRFRLCWLLFEWWT